MSDGTDAKAFYVSTTATNLSTMPDGRLDYHEMSAEGRNVVELPLQNPVGSRVSESVQVRDLPGIAARRIERAIDYGSFYGGPSADAVFAWFRGLAEGSGLLDKANLRHLDKLSAGLAEAADKKAYFSAEIQPFLGGLKPQRRA